MRSFQVATRLLAIVAVCLILLSSSSIDQGVMAETITKFAGGSTEVEIALTAGGQNDQTNLYVPVAGTVTSATFDITGMENGDNNYPHRVQVNVGSLGNTVYVWADRTYGAMGYQAGFTNFQGSADMTFEQAGSNSTLSVRLPEGADVKSATVRMTGAEYDAGWAYPSKLAHKMGNNWVPLSVGWRPTPQLIDYDGDGDLDMLTGGYQWISGSARWIWYFENIGTKSEAKWQENTSLNFPAYDSRYWTQYYRSSPTFVDMDDDDDYDLVIGMYYGGLKIYWNTGTKTSPTWSDDGVGSGSMFYGIDEGSYASSSFADMDNDGDLDMAVGAYTTGGAGSKVGVAYYRNDYSGGNYSWSTTNLFGGIATDEYSRPCLIDYDGDGDHDIFVGYFNGSIGYYENTGSKTTPSWTQRPKVQGNIDVGSYAGPSIGNMDNDGDLDLLIGASDGYFYYYERILSNPEDVGIDVGNDGSVDWTRSGELEGSVTTSDLSAAFEANLKGTYSKTDSWGNNFYDVDLKISTAAAGLLTIDQVSIEYEYTVTSRDFTDILNDYIDDHKDEADDAGNIKVPVIVSSATVGKIKLSNLKIVVDRPPVWSMIPSAGIDEDTKDLQLIDLFAYISDDYTADASLTLKVIQLDQENIVKITLENGRYIGVDAETGSANDNWHGNISVKVQAWDGLGHVATSNVFIILVRPVNDDPMLHGAPPSSIMEDEYFSYQIDAKDVDGDPLHYSIIGAPSAMKVSDTGLITWTPTQDDVGPHSMTIVVADPFNASATMQWDLTVINVNDAPELDLPGKLTVTEGKPFYMSLEGTFHDVDDPTDKLKVSVENAWSEFDETDLTVTLFYPKETGIAQDKLVVTVTDPHGLTATGVIILEIVGVDKLDLIGIPDQMAVEEDYWTVDIKPYLYNVEDYNKLVITTTSSYIEVDGTKLNLHYPKDSLTDNKEAVVVRAMQGTEVATDEFTVTLLNLGHDLALTIIPDQDVLEKEAVQLDITPYIKNAPDIDMVKVTIKASEHVTLNGKVLTFFYPAYYDPESEVVTVTIAFEDIGASREFTVLIHDAEDDFYLAEIPEVTVTETIPETFNIKQYIMNADDISRIDAWTDSPYSDVNRFDIQMTYPDGFTGGEKVRDDLIRVTVSDGLHEFTRAVTIHVNRLGKELQLSGIGDRTVFEDTDLVIDVETFLYNVDEIDDVSVMVTPDTYARWVGFVVTFNFPASADLNKWEVTLRATEGTDIALETIIIYIEKVPEVFTFGPIGSITAVEDVPYVLDVEPFLKNMAPGVDYTIGIHSDHATVEGFVVTFLYETEVTMDEIVRINVTGANEDFAEQDIYVHVKTVNDPPVLTEPIATDIYVKEGEEAVTIDLTKVFTDIDTDMLNYSCDEEVIRIDWENGVATIVFVKDTARPDDLEGVVIYAFDPDDPGSRKASNAFNVTFYLEDEEPPGPGPVGPSSGVQEPDGGSGWIIIALLVIVGVVGVGWMYYRKRKPAQL